MTNGQKINIFVGKTLKEQMDPLAQDLHDSSTETSESLQLTDKNKEEFEQALKMMDRLKATDSAEETANWFKDAVAFGLGKIGVEASESGSMADAFFNPDAYKVVAAGFGILLATGKIKDTAVGTMSMIPMLRTIAKDLSSGYFSQAALFGLRFLAVNTGINVIGEIAGQTFSSWASLVASGAITTSHSLMEGISAATRIGLQKLGFHAAAAIEQIPKNLSAAEIEKSVQQILIDSQNAAKAGVQSALREGPVASAKEFSKFKISPEFLEELDSITNRLKQIWSEKDRTKAVAKDVARQAVANQNWRQSRIDELAKLSRQEVFKQTKMMKVSLIRNPGTLNQIRKISGPNFHSVVSACIRAWRWFIGSIMAPLAIGTTMAVAGATKAAATIAGASAVAGTIFVLASAGVGAGVGCLINAAFFDDNSRWLDDSNVDDIVQGEYDNKEVLAMLEQLLPQSGGMNRFKDKFTMKIVPAETEDFSPIFWKRNVSGITNDDVYAAICMIKQIYLAGAKDKAGIYLSRLLRVANVDRVVNQLKEKYGETKTLPIHVPFQGNMLTNILLSAKHGFQVLAGKGNPLIIGVGKENGKQQIYVEKDNFEFIGLPGVSSSKAEQNLSMPLSKKFEYGKEDSTLPVNAQTALSQQRAKNFTASGDYHFQQQNPGGLPANEDPSLNPQIGVLDRKMKNIVLFDDKGNAKLNPDGTLTQRYPNGWYDIKRFAIDHKIPFDGKIVSAAFRNEIDNVLQHSNTLVQQNKDDGYIDREKMRLLSPGKKRLRKRHQEMSTSPSLKESNQLYWMIRNKVQAAIFI